MSCPVGWELRLRCAHPNELFSGVGTNLPRQHRTVLLSTDRRFLGFMPPTLALLLCSGFVVSLLRLERKQNPNVSHALWIPTLWMMSCACKPLASWFSAGQMTEDYGAVEAGSPWDRTFLICLLLAGILILKKRNLDWRSFRRDNTWLLVIYAYALVSIVWSEFPFVSLKRYIRFGGTLLMALVVLSEREPLRAFESVLRRSAFTLVPFSLLLIKYYPHLGVMFGRWSGQRMWVGVASQKNGLGILCFVSAFFLFWRIRFGSPRDHVVFI